MSTSDQNTSIQKALETIAAENGLSVVIVDPESNVVAAANDNSICGQLTHSAEFAPKCAAFCGKAFERTVEAGGPVDYECHAGLQCRSVPVKSGRKTYVAITGRTFLNTRNYRTATARAIAGDWRSFSPTAIFENVNLSGSPNHLAKVEKQVAELDKDLLAELGREGSPRSKVVEPNPAAESPPTASAPDPFETSLLNYKLDAGPTGDEKQPDPFESSMVNFKLDSATGIQSHDMSDREAWRAFIPSLLSVPYRLACRRILEFLSRHYGIESSLWLQREGADFETAASFGAFEDEPVRIEIQADDKRIRAAVRDDSPIVLKERQAGSAKGRQIQLFPVVIGGEVRNALGVARENMDPELASRILKFCRFVASRLEILRLREAVAERERHTRMMRQFNEQLRNIDADNFWQKLIMVSAEAIGAERASLLVRGPDGSLSAAAAIGARADLKFVTDLGVRVARTVLEKAKPVLVMDAAGASLPSAPAERSYRTSSFISYPITLGSKAIAVLNFTDKAGGESFERRDLDSLDWIAPQIAVAIDRMALRHVAGEYAQLSITDPLTGLLNRRYIEERLTEEINRVSRSGEPVSFMMIDVDEFKSYNDQFGHPAGDEALEIVGRILKDNLRGADVAARYGGEEFSVLLPETAIDEAGAIAERIRSHVQQNEFPHRRVTVSIGIASRSDEIISGRDLISAADRALYQAKQMGRNNVQIYRPAFDVGDNVH